MASLDRIHRVINDAIARTRPGRWYLRQIDALVERLCGPTPPGPAEDWPSQVMAWEERRARSERLTQVWRQECDASDLQALVDQQLAACRPAPVDEERSRLLERFPFIGMVSSGYSDTSEIMSDHPNISPPPKARRAHRREHSRTGT